MSAVATVYREMSHALLVDEALRLRARVAELEGQNARLRDALVRACEAHAERIRRMETPSAPVVEAVK